MMKRLLLIPLLVLAACGGGDEGAEEEPVEPVETDEPNIEQCYSARTCEGLLPLELTGPDWRRERRQMQRDYEVLAESEREALGPPCEDGDSLWQVTEYELDLPICAANRGEAVAWMEAAEAAAEPTTTAVETTTTTEPPPTRKASAPLDNTKWYVRVGFGGMGSDQKRFTFDETGEVHIEFVNCLSEEFCFSWEQDGKKVKIYSHTGSGITYSGTVGPGHIITGRVSVGTISSDPLDNLGKSPQEVLEDKKKAIGWSWGAVWCPERGDCPPADAEEMLSQHVDLS